MKYSLQDLVYLIVSTTMHHSVRLQTNTFLPVTKGQNGLETDFLLPHARFPTTEQTSKRTTARETITRALYERRPSNATSHELCARLVGSHRLHDLLVGLRCARSPDYAARATRRLSITSQHVRPLVQSIDPHGAISGRNAPMMPHDRQRPWQVQQGECK